MYMLIGQNIAAHRLMSKHRLGLSHICLSRILLQSNLQSYYMLIGSQICDCLWVLVARNPIPKTWHSGGKFIILSITLKGLVCTAWGTKKGLKVGVQGDRVV